MRSNSVQSYYNRSPRGRGRNRWYGDYNIISGGTRGCIQKNPMLRGDKIESPVVKVRAAHVVTA